VVDQAGWKHRLTRSDRTWTLAKQTPNGWEPQHAFDEHDEQRPIDYEWPTTTCPPTPGHPSPTKLIVMRLEPGLSRRLIGARSTRSTRTGGWCGPRSRSRGWKTPCASLDVVLDRSEVAELRDWISRQSDAGSGTAD